MHTHALTRTLTVTLSHTSPHHITITITTTRKAYAYSSYPCRWRGAHLMMLSTRRIISAASAALVSTIHLLLYDSRIPSDIISPTIPVRTSMPEVLRPS